MTLDGKVVAITGAARGLGAAAAALCAQSGARVIVADVLDERGEQTAAAIGSGAVYRHLDVTSPSDWERLVDEVRDQFGRLDGLVNNAGINRSGPLLDMTLADFRAVVDVNQVGTFLGMRTAAPLLAEAGGGSIVNMSSIAGMTGINGTFAYAATKFAIRGMTRVGAMELGPLGIRVNSIHPGFFKTEIAVAGGGGRSDIDREALGASLPLGRHGEAEDVAEMVVFLLGDQSAYSTGAEFVVDGGAIAGMTV